MDMIFYRSWMSLPVVVLIALLTRQGLSAFATRKPVLHAWRNAAHFAGQFTWFWAITQIPLAEVFALEFTTPLWVAMLAPLILGERMTLPRFAAVVLGFIGALIVIRPVGMSISWGTASALACAVGYAFSYIAMKQLTRTERPLAILFWLCAFQGLYRPPSFGWLTWPGMWLGLAHRLVERARFHYTSPCLLRTGRCDDRDADGLPRVPLIALVGWLVIASRSTSS